MYSEVGNLSSKSSNWIFDGNIKKLQIRSGTNDLKNVYIDMINGDSYASLEFLSDGENAIRLSMNGKAVWTLKTD